MSEKFNPDLFSTEQLRQEVARLYELSRVVQSQYSAAGRALKRRLRDERKANDNSQEIA